MSAERLFIDTVCIVGLLNQDDQHHARAKSLLPRLESAAEVWVTEAIFIEVGSIFARANRQAAAAFIEACFKAENFRVRSVDAVLFRKSLDLYGSRSDKDWSLTDCISFKVMEEQELRLAATGDQHFRQAGYQALMLD